MAQPHRTNVNWMLLLLWCCFAAAHTQQLSDGGFGVQGASEGGGTVIPQLLPAASVKKDLKLKATAAVESPAVIAAAPPPPRQVQHPDEAVPDEHVVVISERTFAQLEAAAKRKAATEAAIAEKNKEVEEVPVIKNWRTVAEAGAKRKAATEAAIFAAAEKKKKIATKEEDTTAGGHQVHVEESSFKQKILRMDNPDMDLDSFQTGFYFFVGLSGFAILFIVFKIYRLRLSRAERKYGVQGDRSTQELTPLPISIEDGNSDEDDQTLFEINRQQIRIL